MNEDLERTLPPRLMRVAQRLADGDNNAELAAALTIAPHTAEKYVSELMGLVEIHDRVKLALWCREKLGS